MLEINKIYHSDCLEIMKEMCDESVDLIVTDCPYKIKSGGLGTKGTSGIFKSKNNLFKHNDITFAEWVPNVYRILKNNSHCYIMINFLNLNELQNECKKVNFIMQNLLIWKKGNYTPGQFYMRGYELILFIRKGNAKTINNPGTGNIIDIPNKIGNKLHPTEKPVKLFELLINQSSEYGDIILDPFSGSGVMAIAACNTKRNFICIEKDKEYFDLSVQRLKDAQAQLKLF